MANLDVAARSGDARTGARADGERGGGGKGRRPPARRRSVPAGRAVLGGLLVAAALVGLFFASTRTETGPKQSYVVARRAVAPGARLGPDDLATVPLDLPAAQAGRAFTDAGALVGATMIAPLSAGDLIQASAVVAKPSVPPSREITFAVPRVTLTPSLEQGERIDVVATYGSGVEAFTTVVLRNALIVGLDRGRSERVGDQGDAAVTVAVDDVNDAVALAHALQLGKLTVVRSTGASTIAGANPVYRQPGPGAAPSSVAR